MSASAPALTKTWAVGRYTATLTVPPLNAGLVHAVIDWEPVIPDDLTPDELKAYRRGCVEAFTELGLLPVIVDDKALRGMKGER